MEGYSSLLLFLEPHMHALMYIVPCRFRGISPSLFSPARHTRTGASTCLTAWLAWHACKLPHASPQQPRGSRRQAAAQGAAWACIRWRSWPLPLGSAKCRWVGHLCPHRCWGFCSSLHRTCPASSVKAALPCPVIPTQKAPVGLRGALPSFRAAQCCVQCLPHALLAHRALVALHACPQSSGCCPCWPTELWLLSMLAAASDFSVPCTQTSSSGLPLPDNDALLLSGALVEHLAPYLVLPFFAQGVLLDVLLELNGARTPHSPAATLAAMRLLYCE